MFLAVMLLLVIGVFSCEKETVTSKEYSSTVPDETTPFEGFVGLYSDLPDNSPAYNSHKPLDGRTKVLLDLSTVPIFLPKDHPRYEELYEMIVKSKEHKAENILKTTIGGKRVDGMVPIINIERLPSERQKELWHHRYNDGKPFQEASDNAKSLGVISLSQAITFFNDMKNMQCNVIQQCPCIPFQYAADGCYARAHWMRKEFIDEFGFDCQKIFSHGSLSAITQIGCTANWDWHVAPLIRVQTSSGIKQYVVDPGLFTGLVPINTWLDKQKGTVDSYIIKPGGTYGFNQINKTYLNDPNYYSTNYVNNTLYTFKYGCTYY